MFHLYNPPASSSYWKVLAPFLNQETEAQKDQATCSRPGLFPPPNHPASALLLTQPQVFLSRCGTAILRCQPQLTLIPASLFILVTGTQGSSELASCLTSGQRGESSLMSKPFGERGGVWVSGIVLLLRKMPSAINKCVLFTSSTLHIVYITITSSGMRLLSFSSKDDGFMRWVGTCIPCISKPGSAW